MVLLRTSLYTCVNMEMNVSIANTCARIERGFPQFFGARIADLSEIREFAGNWKPQRPSLLKQKCHWRPMLGER
jgi:hypothetical protein